ncbi:MAG: hypothetical protein JWM09_1189 [Francisellaceae bacterium]|nr:hypothetical protein [Francisellaceae bacterium]
MRQVLHACSRTTETVRRTIQNSQETLKSLSQRRDQSQNGCKMEAIINS